MVKLMNTREHLESYIYKTSIELKELKSINWTENRNDLDTRVSSLENLIKTTVHELNHISKN